MTAARQLSTSKPAFATAGAGMFCNNCSLCVDSLEKLKNMA